MRRLFSEASPRLTAHLAQEDRSAFAAGLGNRLGSYLVQVEKGLGHHMFEQRTYEGQANHLDQLVMIASVRGCAIEDSLSNQLVFFGRQLKERAQLSFHQAGHGFDKLVQELFDI